MTRCPREYVTGGDPSDHGMFATCVPIQSSQGYQEALSSLH